MSCDKLTLIAGPFFLNVLTDGFLVGVGPQVRAGDLLGPRDDENVA